MRLDMELEHINTYNFRVECIYMFTNELVTHF